MLQLIVGHRGVGKTSFLGRVAAAYAAAGRPVRVLDLDHEIARATGLPLAALFAQHGEAQFRAQEHRTLAALLQAEVSRVGRHDVYVALGAGYDEDPRSVVPPALLSATRVLWLRRLTDGDGRIFPRQGTAAPRPRLAPQVSPLAEFQQRYVERQARFAAWHDDVWIMPEGSDENPAPAEAAFILAALADDPIAPAHSLRGTITILPAHLARPAGILDWLARRLAWRDLSFELRDDLLSEPQLAQLLTQIPPARILRSFRVRLPARDEVLALCQKNIRCDIPLELSPDLPAAAGAAVPPHPNLIASLHERRPDETLTAAIARLHSFATAIGAQTRKLAVEVADLRELHGGAAWAAQSPPQHAFLPRTPGGQSPQVPERYRWFRTLQAANPATPLCFVREGDGSSPDQPTLCEHWGRHQSTAGATTFAAVLGDPVQHSRSPSQHRALFARYGVPFVAVPLAERELADSGLQLLADLGLRFAAVTAPLKRLAGAAVGLPACNTLACSAAGTWHGRNTDPDGLVALLAYLDPQAAVAIWGGGGTLVSLQSVLPHARAFALRSGQQRDWVAPSPTSVAAAADAPTDSDMPPRLDDASASDAASAPFFPAALIWAAGPVRAGEHAWPPAAWRPQQVFDLDYRDNSTGRDYALRIDAEYISGLAMFRAQAASQAQFFLAFLQPTTP